MAKHCCICQRNIEKDDAPILAIGAYGAPKCICGECEKNIDTATRATDANDATEAIRKLGESLTLGNTQDSQIIETVNGIITDAAQRAEAIRNGSYDFAKDDESEPEFELDEDLLESEEDRALDEKEAKTNKTIDTVTAWACGIILTAAIVFFIVRFIF